MFAKLKGKYLICINKQKNKMKNQKQKVKVLGQTVTVGSKLHAKLIAQVKQFNDLAKYEIN
jgi:hypothetical protein